MTISFSDWIDDARLDPGIREDGAQAVEFAIGDVHGLRAPLEALLDTIRVAALEAGPKRCHLTYLGDLIDRGPDSRGCLALAGRCAVEHGVGGVTCLLGNHEQYLRLFIERGRRDAFELWRCAGADETLQSLGAPYEDEYDGYRERLLATLDANGDGVAALLASMESHRQVGNVLFVHAGIDPEADLSVFLRRPWDRRPLIGEHWCWIREPFLSHRRSFLGEADTPLVVVHGHTPDKVARWMVYGHGMDEVPPHRLRENGTLNLDGGSYENGVVAAAQIEGGRYRVLLAEPIVADFSADTLPNTASCG